MESESIVQVAGEIEVGEALRGVLGWVVGDVFAEPLHPAACELDGRRPPLELGRDGNLGKLEGDALELERQGGDKVVERHLW